VLDPVPNPVVLYAVEILTVTIQVLDPLADSRWDDLVLRHPEASAFHARGWLQALARTYGYEPLALTSASADQPLKDGVALCRVSSWLTGARLVSLPFADHCELLLDDLGESLEFMNWLRTDCDRQRWKYIEIRPLSEIQDGAYGLHPSRSYCFHELDIRPNLEEIFRGFHKDSIQRKIRRAEKEELSYETGRSKQLLDEFYRLVLITRRRHQLLPQPRAWFENLIECMGDKVHVRVARKGGTPISAMLTLRHRSSVIYKYGCSDERFHNLGGMPFLFWRLIEESKTSGAERIDFGRSDLDNGGLIAFKDKFGTTRRPLTYYRYPYTEKGELTKSRRTEVARQFLSFLPDAVCSQAGKLLYRHMG
jgi:CelD/BcsL family acetyltransferase involved in cellulose biosynthesis